MRNSRSVSFEDEVWNKLTELYEGGLRSRRINSVMKQFISDRVPVEELPTAGTFHTYYKNAESKKIFEDWVNKLNQYVRSRENDIVG